MTWEKVVERDMKVRGLVRIDAKDRVKWRLCHGGQKASSHNSGKNGLKMFVCCCHIFTIKVILQQQQKTFILTRLFFPVYWGQSHLWPSHNIFFHLDLSQASSLQSPFFLISSLNTSKVI